MIGALKRKKGMPHKVRKVIRVPKWVKESKKEKANSVKKAKYPKRKKVNYKIKY